MSYNPDNQILTISWSPDPRMCGLRPTSYSIDVLTDNVIFNKAINFFGSFPQDTCSEGSTANSHVSCEGEPGDCNACSKPWDDDCGGKLLTSEFHVNRLMLNIASQFKLNFAITSTGRFEGMDSDDMFWCLKFSKGNEGGNASFYTISTAAVSGGLPMNALSYADVKSAIKGAFGKGAAKGLNLAGLGETLKKSSKNVHDESEL